MVRQLPWGTACHSKTTDLVKIARAVNGLLKSAGSSLASIWLTGARSTPWRSAVLRCELREGHGDHRGPARQAPGRDTHAHGFCAKAREGVDHWVAPLRARVEGLKSLKQLSEVRLLHPLMLRQALKVVQHVCVHPVISALGLDTIAALHAELQDWKSLLQTRTLWLPALQGDCAGLID